MPKNIVLCCDGTANQFAPDRTNVIKLYYTLEQNPATQVAFYHPGLGTMEPVGALTPATKTVTMGLGMALGYGLSNDIRDAYLFLMNHFEEGDSVYLFGFSRGAYTARSVCSLLRMYGLMRRGNDPMVPYAVRMMMAIDQIESREHKSPEEAKKALATYFKLAEDFKHMMCGCECNPHFVGVWDTVNSVGWFTHPLKLPYVSDNSEIAIGRHAISIDERRAFFRNHLWMPSESPPPHGPVDLVQVWFAGVHCDVGGGYPEQESGLSKLAFDWMLQEAKAAGLRVDPDREKEVLGITTGSGYVPPNPDGDLHVSLKKAWKIAEWIPKPHYDFQTGKTSWQMNRSKPRRIPPKSLVHESVFLREKGEYAKKLPADVQWVATRGKSMTAGESAMH